MIPFLCRCLIGLLLFPATILLAEDYVLFTITEFPDYTPASDTLYLTGTFNDWALSDTNYQFKKHTDGTYKLHFKLESIRNFDYKVNRGDWETVEGNDIGDYIHDHTFTYDENIFEHNLVIRSWQDLHNVYFPPIILKVHSVPSNTPHDAKIYVGGSFNGWSSSDPEHELKKNNDGYYVAEINSGLESLNISLAEVLGANLKLGGTVV